MATSQLPKNKDSWGVYLQMKRSPILAERVSSCDRLTLTDALASGDAPLAAKLAWSRWTNSRDGVVAALSLRSGVSELLRRAARLRDDVQTMFMIAAAVLCAMDQVAGDEGDGVVPRVSPSDIGLLPARTVNWYCCDAHTAPGVWHGDSCAGEKVWRAGRAIARNVVTLTWRAEGERRPLTVATDAEQGHNAADRQPCTPRAGDRSASQPAVGAGYLLNVRRSRKPE